jgi:hypothetical protein
MLKFLKNNFFKGTCAINGVGERIRLQEQKLWGMFSGQEVPKTFFGLRWPRLLHNLGIDMIWIQQCPVRFLQMPSVMEGDF